MDLCSILCGSLDGRGVWGRMDIGICMAESLSCSPETITTLLIGYTPIQNKKFKRKKKKDDSRFSTRAIQKLGLPLTGVRKASTGACVRRKVQEYT